MGAVGFYLPGVAPAEYPAGTLVELKVNKLTSARTQLPYNYYTLPVCKPDVIQESVENLGEILAGDLIENSKYTIHMKQNKQCEVLCKRPLDQQDRQELWNKIEDEYMVNWIIDNLPATTKFVSTSDPSQSMFSSGFPVGFITGNKYFVYNHVKLILSYHSNPEQYDGYRIVGFEVEPMSIQQFTRPDSSDPSGYIAQCLEKDGDTALRWFQVDLNTNEVFYTYDVEWVESDIRWASRWDSYLKMTGGEIHWFSILNSFMIMLFLSCIIAIILLRTLHRDITKYNELATEEERIEESGWKLVHGDVFRKPRFAKLLAVSVGSGVQILLMSIVTLVFALLGLLSPANRGGLLQCVMLLFTLMGVAAGYTSSRLYKLWLSDDWKVITVLTATLYPGICFVMFFILNLFIWGARSSGAVPFTTMFAVLTLWFGISMPLVFLGSYLGFRLPAIEVPVRTNHMPRQIKEQPWFMHSNVGCLLTGTLPFGAVFTELFFILSSLWQHQFYYLFGFLALVLVILLVTCAEVAIVMTYFQLTSEDYRWWWKSFFYSGSSAFYVFAYSAIYFSTRLRIDKVVSTILYFGYMFLASLLFFLLTGSIGTLSSFLFVKAIYSSIKVD